MGQSGLHVRLGQAKRLRSLGDTEMLHIPQDQDGAVFLRKRLQCLRERPTKLFLLQRLGWYFSPICKVSRGVVAVVPVPSFFYRFIKVPAVLPQPHFRFVDRDLDQPRAEFRFLAETYKILKSLKDCFLGDILSIRIVFHQGHYGHEHGAFIRAYRIKKASK
jgi:hypothetical protein